MSDTIHTTTNEKLRIAVIGIGLRGEGMAGLVKAQPGVEIVAFVDCIPEKAAWVAKRLDLPAAGVFGSVEEALAKASFEVGMVFVPDGHHADVAIPLLKAGKRIFCEKPLEISAAKCRAFVKADEAAGGKTFVGFNMRHAPFFATAKRCVESGMLGRILTIQADEFYDGGRTYFRRWNGVRAECGGLWITKACHDFDMLTWITGAKPVEIFAHAAKTYYVAKPEAGKQCRACAIADRCPDRAPLTPYELLRIAEEHGARPYDLCLYNTPSDTFDHGMAQIRFENDIFATYTCNVVAGFTDRRVRIGGTKATLDGRLEGKTATILRRDPASVEEIPVADTSGGHGGADPIMLGLFMDFARRGGRPPCTPREASVAVLMGLAATKSGDIGRPVKVKTLAK
ncbi:MAG: Gfo/Idh/MocA family oxidoreductase [Planctomycetota bacterium]